MSLSSVVVFVFVFVFVLVFVFVFVFAFAFVLAFVFDSVFAFAVVFFVFVFAFAFAFAFAGGEPGEPDETSDDVSSILPGTSKIWTEKLQAGEVSQQLVKVAGPPFRANLARPGPAWPGLAS